MEQKTLTGKPAAKPYVQIHSVVHSSPRFLMAALSYGAELGYHSRIKFHGYGHFRLQGKILDSLNLEAKSH